MSLCSIYLSDSCTFPLEMSGEDDSLMATEDTIEAELQVLVHF